MILPCFFAIGMYIKPGAKLLVISSNKCLLNNNGNRIRWMMKKKVNFGDLRQTTKLNLAPLKEVGHFLSIIPTVSPHILVMYNECTEIEIGET